MKIKGHRLYQDDDTPFPFLPSPNIGGTLRPEFLIVHFTAGRSADDSIAWLNNPQAKASAHLVVSRAGVITQLLPFNRVAWHAGHSHWAGHDGLNQFSLGCELDNQGKLTHVGNKWLAWFGGEVPADQVLEAVHKNESQPAGWQTYTEPQIQSALLVANLLVREYGLKDVLGHEDVAPGRKVDPGPAFPMSSFRAKVMGRDDSQSDLFRTTTTLNIRSGPGTEFKTVPGSPLAPNTPVRILKHDDPWVRVDVLKKSSRRSAQDLTGWVHSRYLAVQ
jgi:N-acetylmuramoyl-L-alanine amidase